MEITLSFLLLFSLSAAVNAQIVSPHGMTAGAAADRFVDITGDTMTGPLTLSGSTLTVTGSAFSVGGSTLVVSGGKVGIGTSAPGKTLDIQVSSASLNLQSTEGINKAYTTIINTGGTLYTGLENSVGNSLLVNGLPYAAVFGHGGAKAVQFGTDDIVRMTILPTSGNVGIGTTGPNFKLEVTGTVGITGDNGLDVTQGNNHSYFRRNAAQWLELQSDSSYNAYISSGAKQLLIKNEAPSQDIGFYTNAGPTGTEKMRITSAGNVGIGTTAPQTKLHISSSTLHIDGTGSPAKGAALCLTAAGRLGTCTGGTFDACTCTAP